MKESSLEVSVISYSETVTSQFTYDYCKSNTPTQKEVWDSWNKIFIKLIEEEKDLDGSISIQHCLSVLDNTTIDIAFDKKKLTYSLEQDLDILDINKRSFLVMMRFLPAFYQTSQESKKNVHLYIDSNSMMGVKVFESNDVSLDLLFKSDGEILFTFLDSSDGLTRVSGSSFLTNYLSNSRKINKLFKLISD